MAKAAKRRKKEEDEEFELPEFDEVEYMEKEVNAAKTSFTMIALAIPLAVALYAVTVVGLWGVGFFLALAVTFLLPRVFRFLPWPKVDVGKFERRDWIGFGGTFFFTWLAFWILLLNVPFTDLTPPTVAAVYVNGVAMNPGVQTTVDVVSTVYVNATIFENVDLQSVQLVFQSSPTLDFAQSGGRLWTLSFTVTPPQGYNGLAVVASDRSGRTTEFVFDLSLT